MTSRMRNQNSNAVLQVNRVCNRNGRLAKETKVKVLELSRDFLKDTVWSQLGDPTKKKLKIKGNSAVDPDSGRDEDCHVLEEKTDIYNVMLNLTGKPKRVLLLSRVFDSL